MAEQLIMGGVTNAFTPGSLKDMILPQGGILAAEPFALRFFNEEILCAVSGIFSDFVVELTVAPGASKEAVWNFINVPLTRGFLQARIADTETIGNSGSQAFRVVGGDAIRIEATSSSDATASAVRWSVKFTPDVGAQFFYGGNGRDAELSSTDTVFVSIGGRSSIYSTVEFNHQFVIPTACKIRNLRVRLFDAPGAGKSRAFTVRKNGADQAVTTTISDSDMRGFDDDPAHEFSAAINDLISIKCVPTGVPVTTRCQLSLVVIPDDGEKFMLICGRDSNLDNANTLFSFPWHGDFVQSATETDHRIGANARTSQMELLAIRVKLNGSPGSFPTRSYEFEIMQNGSASGLKAKVSGFGNVAVGNKTVEILDGDEFSIRTTPDATPSPRKVMITVAARSTSQPTVHLLGCDLQGGDIAT